MTGQPGRFAEEMSDFVKDFVMPGARLELARLCGAVDFESTASANSAIPAQEENQWVRVGCSGADIAIVIAFVIV